MTTRITAATALRRREAQARRTQDATGPDAEISRLKTNVEELLAKIRQRDLVIEALRRQIAYVEDEGEDGE
jgi:hypothetical protein